MTYISKQRFNAYRNKFLTSVMRGGMEVALIVTTVVTSEDSFDSFIGESERKPVSYKVRALYEKEIPTRTRDKFGLPKEVNGVLYIPSKTIEDLFGNYRLDWNKTSFIFLERKQVIEKIIYLDEMHSSCIALQIFLKDAQKGG